MTEHLNQSRLGGDYEWHYEYYDDEEPVSFEGLKVNRYSIVIVFWVSLAVFVIFMFFILTLLTKTGAQHLEILDPSEKLHGAADSELEVGGPQAFALPPLLDESRSLFHFCIQEEEQIKVSRGAVIGRERRCGRDPAESSGLRLQGERGNGDDNFRYSFNIPNFVQSEHSSCLDNDDLLLCGPQNITESPETPESQNHLKHLNHKIT